MSWLLLWDRPSSPATWGSRSGGLRGRSHPAKSRGRTHLIGSSVEQGAGRSIWRHWCPYCFFYSRPFLTRETCRFPFLFLQETSRVTSPELTAFLSPTVLWISLLSSDTSQSKGWGQGLPHLCPGQGWGSSWAPAAPADSGWRWESRNFVFCSFTQFSFVYQSRGLPF